MAGTLKMKKYPKKPKGSASATTFENYLAKCRDIDKENSRRNSENKKREALKKRVASIKK